MAQSVAELSRRNETYQKLYHCNKSNSAKQVNVSAIFTMNKDYGSLKSSQLQD